jgi:hypothetical protein
MYARGLCFVLAMSIGVAICAEEKKKQTNFHVTVKYTLSNSSPLPVTLYVMASRKKGEKSTTQNLGTCPKYGSISGSAGIFYHTNIISGSHAKFYLQVDGQAISFKGISFNGLPTNPSNGDQINPSAQTLDCSAFGDTSPESFTVYWSVNPTGT